MIYNYINLSNGVNCPHAGQLDRPRYSRIQSTQCEGKLWREVLWSAPDDLLLQLACGQQVVVHDQSERDRETRAMWQGLELIRMTAEAIWFGKASPVMGRGGPTMEKMFHQVIRDLDRNTRKRYAYYRRFLFYEAIDLKSCWRLEK